MTPTQQKLQEHFGVEFHPQPDILSIRRFYENNTFCTDRAGNVIGLAACENTFRSIHIPEWLRHLQYLNLSDNEQLEELTFACGLSSLWHFDLSDSNVRELILPADFDSLRNMDVSRNNLQKLVMDGVYPVLSFLDISGNEIPELRLDAPELQYAYLLENKLKSLNLPTPSTKLEILHMKNNELERLPEALLQCTGLQALYLYGNRPSNIPAEYIAGEEHENSWEAVRNYLQSITEDETVPNDEVKLVLLGNSTAGKTSLIHFLTEGKFDPKSPSTHGIKNVLWKPHTKDDLKVNIWDFGGQEYYHATHRLFLSTNAVSLVLFEQDTNFQGTMNTLIRLYENKRLVEKVLPLEHFPYSYWLDGLYHFSQQPVPESTMLLQNKLDLNEAEELPIEDRSKYKIPVKNINYISVQGAAEGDKRHLRKFEDFQDDLLDVLEKTRSTYEISTKWLEIKQGLRNLSEEQVMMTYEDYVAFCETIKEGISQSDSGESMLDTLTRYLHEISVILYYDDDDEKLLKETVFINPKWVTNTIYKVLDYEVIRNEGKFDKSHVEEVLKDNEKRSTVSAEQFIELMKKFELIFESKNEPNNYVAPQYLPKEEEVRDEKQVKKYRSACSRLGFTLRYPLFLPKSIMTRIICKYGRLSEDYFWRNGIGFDLTDQGGNTKRVLIQGDSDQQIHVYTEQKISPEIILKLFKDLVEINKRNPNIEVSCNGADFVWVEDLVHNPPQNQLIQATNGEWIDVSLFKDLFLAREGSHPSKEQQSESTKPRVFFSYAWKDGGDDPEKNREVIVDKLYDSLQSDGIQVLRDKNEVDYGGRISQFMQELSRGDLVLIFQSDKYLRSPYCMRELYEIAINSRLDQDEFTKRVLIIPVESIRLDRPSISRKYMQYWEKVEKEWQTLIEEFTQQIYNEKFRRYENVKIIKNHFGKLSEWLIDINTLTDELLSENDFSLVKEAITKRLSE